MVDSSMIQQGIEIVQKAIAADSENDYERALSLYRDALARFTLGLKYEKNEARKKLILERVEGYMVRAEELSDYLKKQSELDKSPRGGSGGGLTKSKSDGDNNKDGGDEIDAEKKKLRGALSGAIVTEKPNVHWDDVAGLENAKESLKETVILPTKFPQLFTGQRKPFKGILLYGPPGTGKSFLAKAVATEADSTFFSISSADLISKWQGESERLVRNLFEMARETDNKRAIIFIDEVDSLCGSRSEGESDSMRRVKTEFLVQMDGVGGNDGSILILGATNIPWELDAAIRRRFEKRVYIPLPEADARSYMVKIHLGDTPNNLQENDFDFLGESTDGASGSDIKVLVKEALMEPLRRCQQAKQFYVDSSGNFHPCERYPNCSSCPIKLSNDPSNKNYDCSKCGAKRMALWDVPSDKLIAPQVTRKDFEQCMRHSVASVSPEELQRFSDWTKQFGQDGA